MQTASAKWLPAIFFTIKKKNTWTEPRSCMSLSSVFSNDQNCREMQKPSGNAHSCGDFKVILSGLSLSGSLGGCWSPSQLPMGGGRVHPQVSRQHITGALCEHLGFGKLTQEYLSSAVKVFGHLPPLHEHCPSICLRWGWNQQPSTSQSSPQQTELTPPLTLGHKREEKH